jgi:hypothetical protein
MMISKRKKKHRRSAGSAKPSVIVDGRASTLQWELVYVEAGGSATVRDEEHMTVKKRAHRQMKVGDLLLSAGVPLPIRREQRRVGFAPHKRSSVMCV